MLPLAPRWRNALIVLLLILPFNLFLFPARHRQLTALSGQEDVIIDVWFAYTPAQVYAVLPVLGEQGRRAYALSEVTLDLAYPALYSTLLRIALAALLRRLRRRWPALPRLERLAVAVFAADVLENLGITALLLAYPARLDGLAWLTAGVTTLKWVLGAASIAVLLVGSVIYVLTARRPRSTAA
jgi:hypothetical protein